MMSDSTTDSSDNTQIPQEGETITKGKPDPNTGDTDGPRRSSRTSKPTERMSQYMEEEFDRRHSRFQTMYEKWKTAIKNCRLALKTTGKCTEDDAGKLLDSINQLEKNVVDSFEHMRHKCTTTLDPLLVRRVDACISLTRDMTTLLNERIAGLDDIMASTSHYGLLRKNQYAGSVFSDLTADSSMYKLPQSQDADVKPTQILNVPTSCTYVTSTPVQMSNTVNQTPLVPSSTIHNMQQPIANAQGLGVSNTQVPNSNAQVLSTVPMLSTTTGSFYAQVSGTNTQATGTVPMVSTAIGSTYTQVPGANTQALGTIPVMSTSASYTQVPVNVQQFGFTPYVPSSYVQGMNSQVLGNNPQMMNNYVQVPSSYVQVPLNLQASHDAGTDRLAKAFADSVNLNRLPVPEPSVFTGDPLKFVEWNISFQALIEKRGIQDQEKIFYLKKYVAGEASKAIEGFFYGGSIFAYENAKKVLQERYGHPFTIQRAFRKKLENWPRIAERDSKALRDFGDFLKSCLDAAPSIPSLKILDDCTENQKLLRKLPNWATLRWNRHVQEALDSNEDYPSFAKFVEFVNKEGKIACNPVSSLFALNLDGNKPRKDSRESNGKVSVLLTSSDNTGSQSGGKEKPKRSCDYCTVEGHLIFHSEKFLALSLTEKRSFIREKKLCYGCLRKGHLNKECKRKHTCAKCKGKHPTCLHEERPPVNQQPLDENQNHINRSVSSTANVSQQRNKRGTSMIVPVWVSTKENPSCEILTYALLDTQSDTTFILDEMCEALKASRQDVRLSLSTMTAMHTIVNCSKVLNIQVRGFNSSTAITIDNAYSRDFIPADRSHIPVRKTAERIEHLHPIIDELQPLQSCDVGLLIGYNCPQALAPRKMLVGNANEPYAVQTVLGWSIVGYSHTGSTLDSYKASSISHRTSVKELHSCSPRDLIKVLESDFAHDHPNDVKYSQDDIRFLNILDESIEQQENKHLIMPLPFKERPSLPNNKSSALLRLDHLKRKFVRDKRYKDDYVKFMNDIIEREFAELVENDARNGETWYIPHHGVYHSKKPGKLRVVFDCSARYCGTSLNEHLLTGPDLTNGLMGVLCRFRQYPVAIMCDVEKMFHQFAVKCSDRDYLRFLWWENGNTDTKPLEYRMRVHLFGAASSPGCANYAFKFLARSQQESFPLASHFIQHDFYVDDGLTSVASEEEANKLVHDAQHLCCNGGLRLHKFISNNVNVIKSISPSERAADIEDKDLSLERLPTERALGIKWCVKEDAFKFNNDVKDVSPTRRNMLSVVASLFDPLGLLAPFILIGKRILQEMCKSGVSWNDLLPSEKKPAWNDWMKDITNLSLVRIDRCLAPPHFMNSSVELHHFSDASFSGYGQCSYIRFVNGDAVHCALLVGKARVAPLKVVTIPRLELTAAVLSVKVSMFLKSELSFTISKEYFWTDSKVVLGYINNDAKRFHVFVANRVQMVRDATEPSQWFYVDSKNNPADHASRGLTASDISESNWLRGPNFLWRNEIKAEAFDTDLHLGDPEIKQTRSLWANASEYSDVIDLVSRFSDWNRAVKFVARLQRLANGIKGTHAPTLPERQSAEILILKRLQQSMFLETLKIIGSSGNVPKTNDLYPLDPIIRNGLLCVGGRLRKVESDISLCKHPVILPRDSHVTEIILSHAHAKACHQGRGITLNQLRALGYWVIGGSKAVASFIRQCVMCRKLRRPTEVQRMADLPEDRVEPTPPFTYCGMDCFGPFITKQGRKEMKRYGLLFTCMCSRAIHIEMLDDMSTDAFINGLRCFIAIRGAVRQIRCDQGSNFIGTKNEFERLATYLTENQCEFVFNAPSASHTGGIWERQIRTVRNILSAILELSPGRLDDSSLRTLFYEAMSIVNCRPLTVSELNDPKVIEPLTPNHILTAKSAIPPPPPGEFVREDLFLRKRWRRVQYLLEQFWCRWKREYLAQTSLRQKWHTPRRNVRVDDIVLVQDVDLPRNRWPLGRVTEARPDDDGLVRRVKVKLSSGILERTIHKLVLIVEG
ncbi:hypothetical protein FSP39_010852 [Pinctada imbricata]|uniref:Uncharacterized protein n=1 Tax=Pinctada imbricata TaxID=66713 RepID=A0AA88YCL3_PINIB|nr:hypothetical protein FSP39_010852 [Pinctada imbricata]